jgi:hypothetical protein
MLYTQEHKVTIMKPSTKKMLDLLICRISIVSACRKVANPWFANGILGENRAMETDAQLAAIQVVRNPWAGPIAQRKDEIAYADAVTKGRHSLRDEIIEDMGSLADGLQCIHRRPCI